MAEEMPRVEAIFHDAAAISAPQERAAFLDSACGLEPDLRRRVEALLQAHDGAEGLLCLPSSQCMLDDFSAVSEGPGSTIGRYKLLEQIGEGGFGVVFMAEQQHPVRRKVALKVIKPGVDTRQVIARFDAERQALALMDHENIAKVFDAGATDAGRPYFVMELVHGVPITEYCDKNQLPPRDRLELFVHVCRAVQHAHTKGIIHRDIKPANVLVTMNDGLPVPKVIDFGVAKATGQQLTEKTLFTHFAQMVGTPLYMSPEQAEMSSVDFDTRSDVYSLGVLLYELLTGTTPLDRERLKQSAFDEVRRIIREEEPPRPSTRINTMGEAAQRTICAQRKSDPAQLGRLVRGELDWIVMKALEKDRRQRYETANGLARDIERYLRDDAVEACPPSAAYRLKKFVRRNKGPVLAATLVLLALLCGIVGATWGMLRASAARAVAISAANQKNAALRDAEDRLWWSLYERARAVRVSRQPGQRLESLLAITEAARIRPDERLRDEAIAAMALPDVRRHMPAGALLLPGGVVAYSAGGNLCARADPDGLISICHAADGRLIRQIAAAPVAPGCCLYFSPDERYLLGLFGDAFSLHVWRVDDGQPALPDQPRGCWAHSFSPDGRRLAVGQKDQILCYDLSTSRQDMRWQMPGLVNSLAFHADSTRIAIGHTSSNVVSIHDSVNGTRLAEMPVGAVGGQVVAWHPDGERLAVGGSDPRIQIWDVPAGRRIATLAGHVSNVTAVPFHPDGDLLASHSWDGVLRIWECATGRSLLQVTMAVAGRPRFGVDGRWPAAGLQGESAELLEVIPAPEYRTLVSSAGAGSGGYRYYADISSDGRFLIVGMAAGARLWDLGAGREVATLAPGTMFAFFDAAADVAHPPLAILAGGSNGLWRWPLAMGDDARRTLRLGEPRKLSDRRRAWFARAVDGRTLAVGTEEGGPNQLLDPDSGTVRCHLGVHTGGEVSALSSDGRWAASSGWHSDRVRLWDAATGALAHEWTVGQQAYVYFSPDSRALIVSRGDEYTWYDLQTFQPTLRLPRDVPQFPGHVAFSVDGKVMALEMAPGIIHLKDVSTTRTIARLTDPHGDRASWQGFTPDGTTLVAISRDASAIHLWNLRAIRSQLEEMNLAWDWPDFRP